ncbi:MAG: hypothetical protein ACI959_002161, partial [Limisphaerales bacterium]
MRIAQLLPLVSFLFFSSILAAQPSNIRITNGEADEVLKGSYSPLDYEATDVIDNLDKIVCALVEETSADSLKALILKMQNFETRNTYADTVSQVRGIGAARRWVYDRFKILSTQREDRLITSYLEFDMPASAVCGPGNFRNIFCVLPGRDIDDPSAVLIEGHMDSRCEVLCDTNCYAPGAEDNASGTALVMELARVLSNYTFDHTLIFLVTIGEEQGLFGAEAFADYCLNEGIQLKAVQNNDVVGGVECGPSSSPPSCQGPGHIDSNTVRIFSSGVVNSPHKDYARFIKTIHKEKSSWILPVFMSVKIMTPEDRSGRGGDHIPFRINGFRSVRFCAANEHGDANTSLSTYEGRQHTTRDVIGIDTTGDGTLDEYYVDFNYLKRNAIINATSMSAAALGPDAPSFTLVDDGTKVQINIADPLNLGRYRIGVREFAQDFNALYEINDTTFFNVPDLEPSISYRVSVASVDDNGVMSLFAPEQNFFSITNSTALVFDTVSLGPLNCATVGINNPAQFIEEDGLSIIAIPNPFNSLLTIQISSTRLESIGGILLMHDVVGR